MSIIRKFVNRLRAQAPIISTPWGNVTESARFQAALNILADPVLFEKVLDVITKEYRGNRQLALTEMKRRYPEAFPKG